MWLYNRSFYLFSLDFTVFYSPSGQAKHLKVICYDKSVVCSGTASRALVMIWFRVLYLSMCAWVLFPSPRHSAVHTHMSCHACNPGPWLRFSLYTAAPDPGENYRQWSSTLCLSLTHRAQAVALMWPVTSASYVAAVAEQQLLLSLSVHLLQVPSL